MESSWIVDNDGWGDVNEEDDEHAVPDWHNNVSPTDEAVTEDQQQQPMEDPAALNNSNEPSGDYSDASPRHVRVKQEPEGDTPEKHDGPSMAANDSVNVETEYETPVKQERKESNSDNDNDDDDEDDDDDSSEDSEDEENDDNQRRRGVKTEPEFVSKVAEYESQERTGVDGKGMFKSWRHQYEDPKFACLDLLDNCFDATLKEGFTDGKVMMDYYAPNGFTILNNSYRHIKSLSEILTAYRSTKDTADAIGEYGVGLKQSVATLSNCNIVISRNRKQFEIGFVAEGLQTKDRVVLPHFTFHISSLEISGQEVENELQTQISDILLYGEHRNREKILEVLTTEFSRTIDEGDASQEYVIEKLVDRCKLMCNNDWGPRKHVFQVVVCDLVHTNRITEKSLFSPRSGVRKQPAVCFLDDIRDLLPKHYVNVPADGFEFFIRNKKVRFFYWQNRLVEMTKFEVNVPKDQALIDIESEAWDREGYSLSIYCGFDALRLGAPDQERQASTCQLCIYSRSSGRLIEVTPDARNLLGLASSGSDFSQGLTVIVDDVSGELPLKPTKDGLTWTKEKTGEIHKSNLYAWVGAVAFVYWKHHEGMFRKVGKDTKTLLAKAVTSFVEIVQRRQEELTAKMERDYDESVTEDPSAERLEKAKFTAFSEVTWAKRESKNSRRVTIRKTAHKVTAWPGDATLFKMKEPEYYAGTGQVSDSIAAEQRLSVTSRKRNAPAVGGDPDSSSGSDEEEVVTQPKRKNPRGIIAKSQLKKSTSLVLPANRATKAARGRRPSALSRRSSSPPRFGSVSVVAPNTGTKMKELENELQQSRAHVMKLESDLQQARRQILQQRAAQSNNSLQQSLKTAQQENAQLRQERAQLERVIQEASEKRAAEVGALRLENEQLRQLLQQRQYGIQTLHNGYGPMG